MTRHIYFLLPFFPLFKCHHLFHGNMPAIHCGKMTGLSFRTLVLTCRQCEELWAVSLSQSKLASPEVLYKNWNSTNMKEKLAKIIITNTCIMLTLALHRWTHFIFTTSIWGSLCYYPYFIDEGTEGQTGKWNKWYLVKSEINSGSLVLRACALNHSVVVWCT